MDEEKSQKAKDLLDWLGTRDAPDFTKARWLGAGVGVVLLLLFAVALVAAVAVLFHAIGQALGQETKGPNLGAGALIAALLGAPFLIWGTVLKHQTVRYQKEGHMTDRINTAVEQLGAEKTVKVRAKDGEGNTVEETQPNIEVRIGAILSLERIAQDSTTHDKGRDHVRVMEILCAYVRENSNVTTPTSYPDKPKNSVTAKPWEEVPTAELSGDLGEKLLDWLKSNHRKWAVTLPSPRADVQIAVEVLARRNDEQREIEAAWPDAKLEKAVWPFSKASDTQNAKPRLRVTGAAGNQGYRLNLTGANLQKINLSELQNNLDPSRGADLGGAILSGVRLEGASLGRVNLTGARLWGVHLEGADLSRATLNGVNLGMANLAGCNLPEASLRAAGLAGVVIDGSTNLCRASFEGACAWDLDMRNSTITQSQAASMFGDASVSLPPEFTPPEHWPKHKLPHLAGAGTGEHDFNTELTKWRADPAG